MITKAENLTGGDKRQFIRDNMIQQWPRLTATSISGTDSTSYFYIKRLMDVTIVLLSMAILLPIMLVISVLIKLDSPGPAFFVQKRVGSRRQFKNGRIVWEVTTFPVFKFRSMFQNADDSVHRAYIQAFVQGTVKESNSPNAKYKLTHDPRITRVGHLLRKTSLDELPQLLNVLRGEMSLVGPRPVPEYEVAEYREAWHYDRLATLPGLTGLWQATGRGQVEFEDMVRLDLEYIRRQSLWLDIKILFLTIPAVLSGAGAE